MAMGRAVNAGMWALAVILYAAALIKWLTDDRPAGLLLEVTRAMLAGLTGGMLVALLVVGLT